MSWRSWGCRPSGERRRATDVHDAEFVWARLAEGKTQEHTAEIMRWSRSQVSNYARLQGIDPQTWQAIATTFEPSRRHGVDEGVAEPDTVVASPFTETLLRDIVPLTADQQRESVQALIKGKIDKAKFKSQAEYFRAVMYPRIVSTDLNVLRLLASFGEACPLLSLGVSSVEDYVEELAP